MGKNDNKSVAGANEAPPATPSLDEVNVLTSAYAEAKEKLDAANAGLEEASAKALALDQEIAAKAETAKQLDDEVVEKTARRDELNESLLKLTDELIGKENELQDLRVSAARIQSAAPAEPVNAQASDAKPGLRLKKAHIFIEGYGNVLRENITEQHIDALVILSDGERTREDVIARYFEQK